MACILEIPPPELIKVLGHDGRKILWPKYKDTRRFCGFHPQEMIDAGKRLGRALTLIETSPRSIQDDDLPEYRVFQDSRSEQARLLNWLQTRPAVLFISSDVDHAIGWDGFQAWDQATGRWERFENLTPYAALVLCGKI